MTKRYRPGDRLRGYDLFRGVPSSQLARADKLFTHLRLPRGRHLIREGEPGVEMFLVHAGEVAVRRGRTEVARLRRGDVVGELALLDGSARNADVYAETTVDVLVQGVSEFEVMFQLAPAVARRLADVARDRRGTARS